MTMSSSREELLRDYKIAYFSGVFAGTTILAASKFILDYPNPTILNYFIFMFFVLFFYFCGYISIKILFKL
jgi:hypothetical protein